MLSAIPIEHSGGLTVLTGFREHWSCGNDALSRPTYSAIHDLKAAPVLPHMSFLRQCHDNYPVCAGRMIWEAEYVLVCEDAQVSNYDLKVSGVISESKRMVAIQVVEYVSCNV